MRIGIDLDGVAYNFDASLKHYLVENEGFDPADLPDPEGWHFYRDQWGMTDEEFAAHCSKGVDAGVVFLHGDPHAGTADALRRLKAAGHTLHVVTHRTYGTRSVQNTMEWLQRHGIPFDTITFSGDKTLMEVDAFIEDNTDNYDALEAAGRMPFLIDRPWNRHHADARRVHSWEQFEAEIANLDHHRSTLNASETVLEEAQRLIYGNRGAQYGHPIVDFKRTGRIWGAILAEWAAETHGEEPVPPALVGLCMVGVKISREVNKPKRDNLVDGAGYFGTVQMVREKEAEGQAGDS